MAYLVLCDCFPVTFCHFLLNFNFLMVKTYDLFCYAFGSKGIVISRYHQIIGLGMKQLNLHEFKASWGVLLIENKYF